MKRRIFRENWSSKKNLSFALNFRIEIYSRDGGMSICDPAGAQLVLKIQTRLVTSRRPAQDSQRPLYDSIYSVVVKY